MRRSINMKIICCGDSFFSLDPSFPRTHLSELIAKKFNAELLNYGKTGSSNFFTCLQIDYALKQNPDLIIFGFTTPGRMEIPIKGKEYQAGGEVLNVHYEDNCSKPNFYRPSWTKVISQSFPNIEKTTAFSHYITELYDEELKRRQDVMMAEGILYKLKSVEQRFIFTRGGLTGHESIWNQWAEYEVDRNTECPWNWPNGPTTYHCPIEKEAELAELWFKRINQLYNFV